MCLILPFEITWYVNIKEGAQKKEKLHYDKWWTIFVLDTSINRISLFNLFPARVQVVALVHPYLAPSTNKKSIIDPALGQTHNIKHWEEERIKWNKFKASGETYFGRQLASWSMCCVADTHVIPLWNLLTLLSVTFLVTLHYVQFVKYIFPRNRTTSN